MEKEAELHGNAETFAGYAARKPVEPDSALRAAGGGDGDSGAAVQCLGRRRGRQIYRRGKKRRP